MIEEASTTAEAAKEDGTIQALEDMRTAGWPNGVDSAHWVVNKAALDAIILLLKKPDSANASLDRLRAQVIAEKKDWWKHRKDPERPRRITAYTASAMCDWFIERLDAEKAAQKGEVAERRA